MTDDGLPLSYGQARLWFISRLDGPSPAYNIPLAVRLAGRLDVDALRAALADVVARHAPLRTVFPDTAGRPRQVVLDPVAAAPALPVTDCREDELPARLEDAASRSFDLATEPPLRAELLRLGPDDHVLSLVVHHIAMDGASVHPLYADLAAAYAARRRGAAAPFAGDPLPVSYGDYTLWQREALGDEADPGSLAAEQLAFWRSALAGAPDDLALPADRPRPARPTAAGDTVVVPLDRDLSDRLLARARAAGATPFMLAQAAVAALLHRLGAGDDIPLGVPVAGRVDEALEPLVGFFVNTLVVRTDVSGDPTFAELLARARATALAAFGHQDVPFERVVDAVNPPRAPNRHPLFQTMVSHQPADPTELRLDDLAGRVLEPVITPAQFDLSFDFYTLADGGLEARIAYAADLFDRATVSGLGERLVRVLRAAADDPGVRVGAIDLLGAGERDRVLAWRPRRC